MVRSSDAAREQRRKMYLYALLDIVLINLSIVIAICLWYGGTIPGLPGGEGMLIPFKVWQWYKYTFMFVTPVCLLVYGIFRFYSNLWKYATIDDIYKIIIADTVIFVAVYGFYYFVLRNVIEGYMLPKRMLLVAWIADIVFFVFSRSGYRLLKRTFINIEHSFSKKGGLRRVMIIGAGYAGYNVVRSIINDEKGYEDRIAVIVVDDDHSKNNTNIMGVRVTYDAANIPRLAQEYEIEEIIIAIPSATNVQVKRIMDFCSQTDCTLKMIPPLSDISDGGYQMLRDVNITDLLFRDEVRIDVRSISEYLKDKIVLVTGGGGSIGSELCRQIVKFEPKRLIIFDVYENNAYELYSELKNKYKDVDMLVRIGSVRDMDCVERVFEEYKPDVVFHAAAHKHVPLMEYVPAEAVKNNVFGTLNVAKCADKYRCDRFVLLSTDKAVNPTNVMGATKRITELIIQELAENSDTKFMAVRFGNVLGSNGSVIPLFKKQIRSGGPVTVTHKDITRFFMTIPEACRLVLQAAGLGKSGRIFVLDMGDPVKIDELARNLIRLSGFVPDRDIKIEYTGLRPGEKLYEELIMDEEKDSMQVVYDNKIFVTKPVEMDYEEFNKLLDKLYDACFNAPEEVRDIIKEIVPNFHPEVVR